MTAFENQFFAHIRTDGNNENTLQTDNLTVIKKHKDYVEIKKRLI